MANNFALITKYMQQAIDSVLVTESKTKILENGSKFIDLNFKEAGYVKVMSLLMDGLSDYYRVNGGASASDYSHYISGSTDGYKVGSAEGKWELFKLEYDRGRQFQVDNMDDEETAGLVIGNLLTEFFRTKVVPEIDSVRFSKMASKCSTSLGNRVSEALTSSNILEKFHEAFQWLTEHEVPEEEQVIFVNPQVMTYIRNSEKLYKHLSQAEYGGDVKFKIETYEGRPIIEVPTSRFYTDILVGDNGYAPTANSKVINYMVTSKRAVVPVVKLNKSKIWTPETVQDFDGYKINFRLYHDVIIPKNKVIGVYTSVSETSANSKTNLLSVDLALENSKYVLKQYYTTPAGLLGRVVRGTSAYTLGSTVTINSSNVITELEDSFSKFGSETSQYFALIDGNNKVIAASSQVTLPTA